jgi:hypothetical protein
MSIKSEISWKRRTETGEKLQFYARRFGGEWRFHVRSRRFEDWQPLDPVPLEDWLELLDAIERRIPRRLFPPEEAARVRRMIRERYPEAHLP